MTDDAVDYQTDPSRYRHWQLRFDGPVATLAADFDENAGLRPGYKLAVNSYDLGVDIELNDAVNRIRFEHPEVRSVVIDDSLMPDDKDMLEDLVAAANNDDKHKVE